MNKDGFLEREFKSLQKVLKFRLPHVFKKVGVISFILSISCYLIGASDLFESELLKLIGQKLMLLSLLTYALSKEIVEDEFIFQIRSQSFSLAFVFGVMYSIYQPIVNYFVYDIINKAPAEYSNIGEFEVLMFMLMVYVGIFKLLKRVA